MEDKKKNQEQLSDEERERRLGFARQAVAVAWCSPTTSQLEMNEALAEEFARIHVKQMYEPHLGCATTESLFRELIARFDEDEEGEIMTSNILLSLLSYWREHWVDKLNYKTISYSELKEVG